MVSAAFNQELFSHNPLAEYLVDAGQRTILFWDVMRQRGNQYLEHQKETVPHVLKYDFEVIIDGCKLPDHS